MSCHQYCQPRPRKPNNYNTDYNSTAQYNNNTLYPGIRQQRQFTDEIYDVDVQDTLYYRNFADTQNTQQYSNNTPVVYDYLVISQLLQENEDDYNNDNDMPLHGEKQVQPDIDSRASNNNSMTRTCSSYDSNTAHYTAEDNIYNDYFSVDVPMESSL